MRESSAGSVSSGPCPAGRGLLLSQLRALAQEAIAAMPLRGAGQEAAGPLGTLCVRSSSWGLEALPSTQAGSATLEQFPLHVDGSSKPFPSPFHPSL